MFWLTHYNTLISIIWKKSRKVITDLWKLTKSWFFQNAQNVSTMESIISEDVTSFSDESYDVQNVTVPLTICLAIMVG